MSVTQGILYQGSAPCAVDSALIPCSYFYSSPKGCSMNHGYGKEHERNGFGQEGVNGYQQLAGKVSWRKERSGQREHGSDNGSDVVK